MSLLVQALTSDDDVEIMDCVNAVKNVSLMGLINESVDVQMGANSITRSWFAWANSVFAQTVLYLAEKKPELIFESDRPYKVGEGFL